MTRSGREAAISVATYAPVWCPTRATRSIPSSSRSATAAAAQRSIESSPSGSGDESPKPTVSIAITRRRSASSGMTSRYSSQDLGVWCSSRTAGPVARERAVQGRPRDGDEAPLQRAVQASRRAAKSRTAKSIHSGLPQLRVALADLGAQGLGVRVDVLASTGAFLDRVAHVLQVGAERRDQLRPADLPVAGHDDARPERGQPVERLDPRRPVRRPEHDREEAVLDEVAREEHSRVRDEHHLVAGGVRAAHLVQLDRPAAQVEGRRAVVRPVRRDDRHALEQLGDLRRRTCGTAR